MSPSSMSAHNQSRSDSRTSYLDPVIDRPNLHIATEQTVTRVLLRSANGTQKAVGVEVCTIALPGPAADWQTTAADTVCH